METYNNQKQKILVTGGVGFIGSALIKRLVKEEHEVVCIDDYSSGTKDNEIEGVTYYKNDINLIDYTVTESISHIFHLAALSRIQPSFINPSKTFYSNTVGTEAVLEFARKNNCKVVYAGSSSKHHDPKISPYANSKYLGEELLKSYKEVYGLKAEIARFYNVYGPGELVDGEMAAVIGIWRKQMQDSKALTIVGDGKQKRDFTHIDDIVDGLIKIMYSDNKHPDAWELGTGKNYSIETVAKWFNKELEYIPNQKGNYRETLRMNSDAIEYLGWEPKDRLKEYIQEVVEEYEYWRLPTYEEVQEREAKLLR